MRACPRPGPACTGSIGVSILAVRRPEPVRSAPVPARSVMGSPHRETLLRSPPMRWSRYASRRRGQPHLLPANLIRGSYISLTPAPAHEADRHGGCSRAVGPATLMPGAGATPQTYCPRCWMSSRTVQIRAAPVRSAVRSPGCARSPPPSAGPHRFSGRGSGRRTETVPRCPDCMPTPSRGDSTARHARVRASPPP